METNTSYPYLFQQLLAATQEYYIGEGNPHARILVLTAQPLVPWDAERVCNNRSAWLSGSMPTEFPGPLLIQEQGHSSRLLLHLQKLGQRIFVSDNSFLQTCFCTALGCPLKQGNTSSTMDAWLESVHQRCGAGNRFLSHPYFQQFPIVLLVAGDAVSELRSATFNPFELFGFQDVLQYWICRSCGHVHSQGRLLHVCPQCRGKWDRLLVYEQQDPPKLLLHTRHFSSVQTDRYLDLIADRVKGFMRQQGPSF